MQSRKENDCNQYGIEAGERVYKVVRRSVSLLKERARGGYVLRGLVCFMGW